MILSDRLKRIADNVPKSKLVIDIGTDHAFIPVYLANQGLADKIIAADISKGSLEKAEKNVSFYGLDNVIECRIGDGLGVLKANEEADVIIAAGMGGMLVIHVLLENEKAFLNAKRLILSPQRDIDKVRRFVHEKGFKIIKEDIIKDERKIYNIIVCEKGVDKPYSDSEYIFGRFPISEKNPVLKEFIISEVNRMKKVINNLVSLEEHIVNRKNEIHQKLNLYEEVLKCL